MRTFAPVFCLALAASTHIGHVGAQQPSTWRGTITLSLGGSAEIRDAYIFRGISGLAADGRGRIFVSEQSDNRVRVYSPKGQFLFTIGQAGEGPGDLARPCCISFGPDGTLWVKEMQNHRYSAFAVGEASARLLKTITLRAPFTYGGVQRVEHDRQGHLLHINGLPFVNGKPSGVVLSAVDSDGNILRSRVFPEPPDDSVKLAINIRKLEDGSTASSGAPQPFGPVKVRAFGPNGDYADAITSTYVVRRQDGAGRPLPTLSRQLGGPALSDSERVRAGRIIASIEKRWGKTFPFPVPDRKPPISQLGFDLNGLLWVELSMPDGSERQADVYDRAGRRVAVATWPANVNLWFWAIDGTTAYGVATDELGTESVVRLKF